MLWQYGNYKFDCNLKPPTFHKFSEWKKDFFRLPNVTKYKVWLTGGFVEDWKTLDIDIILTNKPNFVFDFLSAFLLSSKALYSFIDIFCLPSSETESTDYSLSVEVYHCPNCQHKFVRRR